MNNIGGRVFDGPKPPCHLASNPRKRKALAAVQEKTPHYLGRMAGIVGSLFALSAVLMLRRSAVHKVIRRPRPRELHPAILELLYGRGVLVLIPLHRLVVDQVSDIQQHLACIHSLAGDLFGEWKEHAVHLDRKRAGLRLALPLTARTLPQAGQILLSHGHVTS